MGARESTVTTDPPADWSPMIRALIYSVQFDRDPLDGVDRALQTVVDRHALGCTRDGYRAAIRDALAGHEPLAALIPQDHSEDAIRRFLEAVQSRLAGP